MSDVSERGIKANVVQWLVTAVVSIVMGIMGARLEINDRITAARAEAVQRIEVVNAKVLSVEGRVEVGRAVSQQQFEEILRSLANINAEILRIRQGQ